MGFLDLMAAAAVRSLAWHELNINYVCQVYNAAAFSPCHFTSFEPRFKAWGAENIKFPFSACFVLTKKL